MIQAEKLDMLGLILNLPCVVLAFMCKLEPKLAPPTTPPPPAVAKKTSLGIFRCVSISAPTPVSPLVGRLVRQAVTLSDFRCVGVSGPSQSFRRDLSDI